MLSGVVLAGGRGERMGAYKPLVPFRGRPLVAWSADALRPLVSELLVAAGPARNVRPLAEALPDALVFPDGAGPAEGPLAGLVAAARLAKGERLLVAPADAPWLEPRAYGPLLETDADAACFEVGGELEPLVAVIRRRVALEKAPSARSIRGLLARAEGKVVEAGALAPLLRDVDDASGLLG